MFSREEKIIAIQIVLAVVISALALSLWSFTAAPSKDFVNENASVKLRWEGGICYFQITIKNMAGELAGAIEGNKGSNPYRLGRMALRLFDRYGFEIASDEFAIGSFDVEKKDGIPQIVYSGRIKTTKSVFKKIISFKTTAQLE